MSARVWVGLCGKGTKIKIRMSHRDQNLIGMVRTLQGRKYKPDPKPHWIADFCVANVLKLESLKTRLEKGKNYKKQANLLIMDAGGDLTPWEGLTIKKVKIKGLKCKLRRYQKEAVWFCESRHGRFLNADEMGIGKTIETIAWLQLRKKHRPVVVVVPGYLKYNWEREIRAWMPKKEKTTILSGKRAHKLEREGIYIINYAVLFQWKMQIRKLQPSVIVFDEIHHVKNRKAQRTRAAISISRDVPHVIGLTGTPIKSRSFELFTILSIIAPSLFPSFWYYMQRYCGAEWNGWSWDFKGDDNSQELHKILHKSVMLRRRKRDVLKELPPVTRSVIPMEIDNKGEYRKAERDLKSWLQDKGYSKERVDKSTSNEALTKVEYLKQIAVKGKTKAVIQWVESFLASDEKLILYCVHKSVVKTIHSHFESIAVRVDGSVPLKKRHKAQKAFQKDDQVRLFIGNIEAASLGLNLTAASNTATIEFMWSPSDHDQADARMDRIGQTADKMNCWYLAAMGTVEIKILELLDRKRDVFAQVVDGKEAADFNLVDELVKELQGR